MAAQHPEIPQNDLDTEVEASAGTDAGTAVDPVAPLSRKERRAAAHGKGPAQKVFGPAATRLGPPPAKARNYAARKGG